MSGSPLVDRMQGYGTTVFAELSELALATGSINLGQGFPDSDGPEALLAAAATAIRNGHNQYPPGSGVPALRQAVARHQKRWYDLEHDPDTEVLITTGATEAVAAAILALAGPGDEVVMFEPYYDSYPACISLAGASRRTVTLHRSTDPGGGGWGFDVDDLARSITARTRLILLNTPHNPTGKVFTPAELQSIAELARLHDLIVVCDEVYEHLVFDARAHVPLATLPGMRERTLTVSSAGKTFSVTGWKIGWVCGPAQLISAVRTVKQFLTYATGAPFQPALAQALDDHLEDGVGKALQVHRDLFCAGLRDLDLDVITPEATYFATVDVGCDALDFCRELPVRAGVVAIPSSVFYDCSAGSTFVRFAFCKRPEVLDEALQRLATFRLSTAGAAQ